MIKIISVGKKHEPWVQAGIERYQKRLRAPWNVEWVLLPHSSFESDMARQEESERILKIISSDDYVILLDETGQMLSSLDLAEQLESRFIDSKPVVVVIGGAYGVNQALLSRSNLVWSLSKLVFPHQLVRLILAEQLYRAQSIAAGNSYHHQ